MAQEERHEHYRGGGAGSAGVFFWFAGWLLVGPDEVTLIRNTGPLYNIRDGWPDLLDPP